MLEYRAEIIINASPKNVWLVLIDLSKWREWDPNCIKIEGTATLGGKLKLWSRLSPKRAFPVKITALVPNQKLVFAGGMPMGLMLGVRTHTLREIQGTSSQSPTTQFAMQEQFSGMLVGMMKKSIPDMTKPFQDFCQGLKARCEQPPKA